jgi:hypothetical protein
MTPQTLAALAIAGAYFLAILDAVLDRMGDPTP